IGALLASAAYALWHPGSDVPCVGASGAVAAAMGAFLICFYDARIQFWYLWLFPLRSRIFEARALWALPIWFVGQLWESWIEAHHHTGVASSAHVGGFVVGVLIAVILKLSRVEQKYLLPATAQGVEWTEDPDFVRALDVAAAGRPAEAVPLLTGLLARNPQHAGARRELCRLGLELGDRAAVEPYASDVMVTLAHQRQALEVVEMYRKLEPRWPDLRLSDRALAAIARCAGDISDTQLALRVTARLIAEHPDSPIIPSAMWHAAGWQQAAGRLDLAEKTLHNLIRCYPNDPCAAEARRKLSGLRAAQSTG